MSTGSLPLLADIPSYIAQPRGDERTLGLSRLLDVSRLGNWTKKVGHATLTLADQPLNSELPTYGRNTSIHGFVTLDSSENVASVQLKVPRSTQSYAYLRLTMFLFASARGSCEMQDNR